MAGLATSTAVAVLKRIIIIMIFVFLSTAQAEDVLMKGAYHQDGWFTRLSVF